MYNNKMAKKKIKEHGTEYVLLNDNKNELWEIDYDRGHATNVSEYLNLDSLNNDIIIRYTGSIEDFLAKERDCKNIHFHESMNLPARPHMQSCSFETRD
jgi:hypothetical protein